MKRADTAPAIAAPRAEERFHWILTRMVRIAVPIHIGLIALFLSFGIDTMAWLNLASIASYASVYALLRQQRIREAFAVGATELILFNVIATLAVGWASGFHYYLLLLPVLFVLHPVWSRPTKAGACVAICAAYGLLALHAYLDGALTTFTASGSDALGVFNALTFATTLSVLAFAAGKATGDAEDGLRRATQTLEELSNRDPLTGLLNRRATEPLLHTAHARQRRTGEPYTIAIIDLDHFKRVNDQHGHACGDAVLGTVAGAIEGALRTTDHIARWGGEEFLVLLSDTTPAGAHHAALKLLHAIRNCHIDCDNGTHLTITATIGIAPSTPDRPIEATIHAADEALYAGKQAGRDRVTISAPERTPVDPTPARQLAAS